MQIIIPDNVVPVSLVNESHILVCYVCPGHPREPGRAERRHNVMVQSVTIALANDTGRRSGRMAFRFSL